MSKEDELYAELRKLAEDFNGEILFPSDTPISNNASNLGLSIDFMLSLKRGISMTTTRPTRKIEVLNNISDGIHPPYKK